MNDKPTFFQLRILHNVGLHLVQQRSGVHVFTLWDMMLDRPVSQGDACAALEALSYLTRKEYTLENVDVKVQQG